MKIYITSIFVDDQAKACAFYTGKLGFQVKRDIPLGEYRWLTLTANDDPNGTELLLEPSNHAAVEPFKAALMADGIPVTSFQVDDIDAEFSAPPRPRCRSSCKPPRRPARSRWRY